MQLCCRQSHSSAKLTSSMMLAFHLMFGHQHWSPINQNTAPVLCQAITPHQTSQQSWQQLMRKLTSLAWPRMMSHCHYLKAVRQIIQTLTEPALWFQLLQQRLKWVMMMSLLRLCLTMTFKEDFTWQSSYGKKHSRHLQKPSTAWTHKGMHKQSSRNNSHASRGRQQRSHSSPRTKTCTVMPDGIDILLFIPEGAVKHAILSTMAVWKLCWGRQEPWSHILCVSIQSFFHYSL